MTHQNLLESLADARYVQINEHVFETEYVRSPDERMMGDDIVLEVKNDDTELSFTANDFSAAEYLGDGIYRLQSGLLLRSVPLYTLH